MGKTVVLVSIWLVVCALAPASGATFYVDWQVSAPGNGQSLETAFKTIQDGIDAASDADKVVVAGGTYVENIQFKGKNITLTSTDPLDPDTVASTVIDGNQSGSVVTFEGTEDETCVLAGFTIRNGSAEYGGGICGGTGDDQTHATIRNNIITGNSVSNSGGGLAYCLGLIESNTIVGNSAAFGGGLYACNGTIRGNLIAVNSSGSGGGLYACNGTIESSTISDNVARVFGGGLRLCRATIRNCVIWANKSASAAQLSWCTEPTYSCIQEWLGGGEGNIAESPQFVNANGPDGNPETYEDNDYRLAGRSSCIDVGKNDDWMTEATDLDGNPRILCGAMSLTVDMGAYEYVPSSIISVARGAGDEVQLVWTSSPGYTYTIWWCVDLSAGGWAEQKTVPSQGDVTSWTDVRTLRRMKFYRVETR